MLQEYPAISLGYEKANVRCTKICDIKMKVIKLLGFIIFIILAFIYLPGALYYYNTAYEESAIYLGTTTGNSISHHGNRFQSVAPKSTNFNNKKNASIAQNMNLLNNRNESQLICDSECRRFKSYMDTHWPTTGDGEYANKNDHANRNKYTNTNDYANSHKYTNQTHKPRAAIYILTHRVTWLIKLLRSIDQYFNDEFQYPIIIFHERDLIESRDKIKQATRSAIFFQLVEFEIPSFLKKEDILENIPCSSAIAYRHMCRFQVSILLVSGFMMQLNDITSLLR